MVEILKIGLVASLLVSALASRTCLAQVSEESERAELTSKCSEFKKGTKVDTKDFEQRTPGWGYYVLRNAKYKIPRSGPIDKPPLSKEDPALLERVEFNKGGLITYSLIKIEIRDGIISSVTCSNTVNNFDIDE